MNDLVSIIMPSYNSGRFIAESIQSVLNQSYQNWELIIVDDCSDDNTDFVVQEFLSDERIRYLKNKKNCGAAVTRNKALREVKGRWIAFLDSDDLWTPNKLSKQIAFMETNGYSFSYTCYEEIDENGAALNRIVFGPERVTQKIMYQYCYPGCLTVMYDAKKIGLIQIEDIKKNNDYAMWLKISKKADCYLYKKCLAKYRKRKGSVSRHNVFTMIGWHYKMWREAETLNIVLSMWYTFVNLFFGMMKKIRYIKWT